MHGMRCMGWLHLWSSVPDWGRDTQALRVLVKVYLSVYVLKCMGEYNLQTWSCAYGRGDSSSVYVWSLRVSILGGTCLNIHCSAVIWLGMHMWHCMCHASIYYFNMCVCMYRLYDGSAHEEFKSPRQLPLHPDLSTVALRQLVPPPHNAGLKSATVAALILWLTADTSGVVTVPQFFVIGWSYL